MTEELLLRRRWTLRAHGRQAVFVKKPYERGAHVVMKALRWALYLPQYPNLTVEVAVGDRYKPDIVALDDRGGPIFWGEAGEVRISKISSLVRRYRSTHVAIAKWGARLDPLAAIVGTALEGLIRRAPFDLINFPPDSADRFIDDGGRIQVSHADLEWVRLG